MSLDSSTYVDLFTMNFGAFRAVCRDLSEEEALRRPGGTQSPALWIAGHVAAYRQQLLRKIGGACDVGIDLLARFGRDTKPDFTGDQPKLADVTAAMSRIHAAFVEHLKKAGDAVLAVTTTTPAGAVLPLISFLHFHESYHLGQLGYLRTWLGKPPLVAPERPAQ